jgi:hypothetical protein
LGFPLEGLENKIDVAVDMLDLLKPSLCLVVELHKIAGARMHEKLFKNEVAKFAASKIFLQKKLFALLRLFPMNTYLESTVVTR